MTTVRTITQWIEEAAPLALQEEYDNAGLLIGSPDMLVTGVLLTVDVTEDIVDEAIQNGCNLIISHHPLIFRGIKNITGQNDVQRCVLKAIKNEIAVYAAHTNMDNVMEGVNGKIADKIGLKNRQILQPKKELLLKLVTFVPADFIQQVRNALFEAGAGSIGNYDNCSYMSDGRGTFRANEKANPFVGEIQIEHTESEIRLEVIFPEYLKVKITNALLRSHPYEEPAYDFIALQNTWNSVGAGIVGELPAETDEMDFLHQLKSVFHLQTLRHTSLLNRKIRKIAVCGGSGSDLTRQAIAVGADVFISADFKYHEFFDAKNKILIVDIGHYESEQFTKDVFYEIITKKIPKFAVRISDVNTNPIKYL